MNLKYFTEFRVPKMQMKKGVPQFPFAVPFIALFLIALLVSTYQIPVRAAEEGPQQITLDGHLSEKNSQVALKDTSVQFIIQILSKDKSCVIYEETQNNVPLSEGDFTISVGTAVGNSKRTFGTSTMASIFQNTNSIPGNGCTYVPQPGDSRFIGISVTLQSGVTEDLGEIEIGSVPSALVAETVQGLGKDKLLQVKSTGGVSLTQTNLEAAFTGAAYTNLQSILAGNFTSKSSNGSVLPSITGANAGAPAGSMWFDSGVVKYFDGTTVQTLGTSAGGIASLGGQTGTIQTFSNDTNVTITSSSNNHALGWSGQLSLARGGTNANLTAVNGGAVYSTGTALGITAAGTSGQVLTSNGAAAPTWQSVNDSTKVIKSGDTMTGLLVLSGDPSAALGSATKQYVDSAVSTAAVGYILKNGTVAFTGDQSMGSHKLTNITDPTAAQDAATKNYADSNLVGKSIDPSMSTLVTGAVGNGKVLTWDQTNNRWTASAPGSAPVSSVFGRTGAVTAQANDYTWAQVDKTTSSLADLTTRSAGDLSSGTLADARLSSNVPLKNAANTFSVGGQNINIATTTDVGLTIKGAAAQTGDLQQWKDSANTVLYSVNATGTPTNTTDLTTKSYVDTSLSGKQASLGFTPVNMAGDTMSGTLNLPSNGLAVGTSQLVVSGGNVGIGTTAPSTKLDISGETLFRNGGNSSGAGATYQLRFGYQGSTNHSHFIRTRHNFGSSTGNAIDFYTGDGTTAGVWPTNAILGMSIEGGNIGIGTTTPAAKLDIIGSSGSTIKIVDGNQGLGKVLTSDANGQASWQTPGSGFTGTGNAGYITKFASGSSVADSILFESSGKLGVGTTAPSTILDISGETFFRNGGNSAGAGATYQLRFGYQGTTQNSHFIRTRHNTGLLEGNAIDFYTGDGTAAGVWPTNAVLGMSINGGNIGIGTTGPTAKLHLPAGTAAANTAPLKLTAGTNLTTPEPGAIEFDGTSLFYTTSAGVRQTLGTAGGGITALTGDVTASGSGSVAATVASVGGSTAANVNTATVAVNTNATAASTASVLVKRDASGISNFKGLKLDGATSGTFTQTVPAAVTSYSVTWPSAVTGTANSVLASDTSGNLSWINLGSVAGSINLTSQVTGVLPIANGGTNSSTALTNNQLMYSGSGAIKELGAMTDGQIVVGKNASAPQIVSMSGDVTIDNTGATTVGKVSGTTVSGVGLANNNILQNTSGGAIAGNSVLVSNGTGTGVTALASPASGVLISSGTVPAWSSTSSDTFTQYALLAGRNGGQTLNGGTAASDNLTLDSTAHATKGKILLAPSGGKVGIGTTSPSAGASLHVKTDQNSQTDVIVDNTNAGVSAYAEYNAHSNAGDVSLGMGSTAANGGLAYLWTTTATPLQLGTNSTERMRILSTGNIGIGTTNPSSPLQVSYSNTATSGSMLGLQITPTYNQASGTAANTDLLINRTQTAVGSGAQRLIDAQVGGTSKFYVDNNGNVNVTGSVTATSFSGSVSTATNVAGGAAGSLPFQTASATTSMLAIGAANSVLTSSGSAPQWTATLGVASGGTGVATLTGMVKGNGTSAFSAATAGTDYSVPSGTESFSGAKTFDNSMLILKGSSTGTTTFSSANAGASNYTLTVPAATDTLVGRATTDTLTNKTWNGNAIGAIYGGTGFTTYTTGDLIYSSASNTLSKLAVGTTGQVLTVSGGVPTWSNSSAPANSVVTYLVRVATTANITLSGTQSIDGVAVSAGDRVLVKNQSTASQNGVYVVAAGAWSRATDLDAWAEAIGYIAMPTEGSTYTRISFFSQAATGGTIGTTSLTFDGATIQLSNSGTITDGVTACGSTGSMTADSSGNVYVCN